MKIFAVSDIHSFYIEFIKALSAAGFDKNNSDHMLVICGDLFDRGPDANKCLNFVLSLPEDRVKFIKGNHEELLEEVLRKGYFERHDIHNRTNETVYQLSGISPDSEDNYANINMCAINELKFNEQLKNYLDRCIDFYEIGDYIFVHGWIPITYEQTSKWKFYGEPCFDEDWRNSWDWSGARWLNGMEMWKLGIREPEKTIVCGHWHSSWGHSFLHGEGVEFTHENSDNKAIHTEFIDDGVIALDACTAISGIVNCVVLEV